MTETIDAQALADLRSYVFAREFYERAYSVHLAAIEAVIAEYTEGKRDLADQLNRPDLRLRQVAPFRMSATVGNLGRVSPVPRRHFG